MVYIFDIQGNLIDVITNDNTNSPVILNDNFKRQINGEWSYSFEINFTKQMEKNIKVKNKVGFFDDANNFQLFSIEKVEDNFGNTDIKTVSCLHDFFSIGTYVLEDLKVPPIEVNLLIPQILSGTPYELGTYTDLGLVGHSFTYQTRLQAFNTAMYYYKGEANYRIVLNANKTAIQDRFVDIGRIGQDTAIRFDFDLNITGIKRTVDTSNLFNKLYGRGTEGEVEDEFGNRKITFADIVWSTPTNPTNKPLGQRYVSNLLSIAIWGKHEGIYDNDTIGDKNLLLQRTYERLQETKDPEISYEVSIIDLAKITGYEHLKVSLGDSIRIYDTDYDINIEARIVEENYSIFDPMNKQIVLGNYLKGFTHK